MESLSWFIQVGPKCNYMYPYQEEAEGDLTTEEAIWVITEFNLCYQILEVKNYSFKL